MKRDRDIEVLLRQLLRAEREDARPGEALDRRVAAAVHRAQPEPGPDRRRPSIRRIVMKHPLTGTAVLGTAAAGFIFAVLLILPTPPASYAIAQTLEAIQDVRTVFFEAVFFKQGGPVECWIECGDHGEQPRRLAISLPGFPVRKVDGPGGSHLYNHETKRTYRVRRDDRQQTWHLDFARFLESSLTRADTDDRVTIEQTDRSGRASPWITIEFRDPARDWRVLVDPDSKLPAHIETTVIRDFMSLLRPPIVVRSMTQIVYNRPIPEAVFAIPSDAVEVHEEVDVLVHRDLGLAVGGRTRAEACEALVKEAVRAMQDMDWDRVNQLYLPFMTPPADMEAGMRATMERTGRPLIELVEIGAAEERGPYWFLPATAREADGTVKNDPARIRFFTLGDEERCIIAMPNL